MQSPERFTPGSKDATPVTLPHAAGLAGATSLCREAPVSLHDQPAFAALDPASAGTPPARALAAVLTLAALLASAWLLLTGAALLFLVHVGVAPAVAVLPAIVVNATLALLVRGRLRRKAKYRAFRRRLASLRGGPAAGRP